MGRAPHVCQMRAWRDAGLPALRVAINLAASHFLDDGLLPLLVGETQRYGIPPEQIELELTESMVMQDTARVRAMLGSMHAHGFQLAIDDFGVGYSSLSLLSFLPVDTLKIDRSFVEDMLNVPRQASIVRAIIVDENGVRCPNAFHLIEFNVEGAGKLIATDSGDQYGHEPYISNERSAYMGECIAIIRANKHSGTIRVTARAEGIEGVTTAEIRTK